MNTKGPYELAMAEVYIDKVRETIRAHVAAQDARIAELRAKLDEKVLWRSDLQVEQFKDDLIKLYGQAGLGKMEAVGKQYDRLWQALGELFTLRKFRALVQSREKICLNISGGQYSEVVDACPENEPYEWVYAVPVDQEATLFGMKVIEHPAAPEDTIMFTDQAATEVLGVFKGDQEAE